MVPHSEGQAGASGLSWNAPRGRTPRLASLSTGTLDWIRHNAGYLDSNAGRSELPVTPRVKALLQLALLRHFWAKARPGDEGLDEVTAIVHRAWRRPGFPPLIAADPSYARHHGLMYGALAPPGISTGFHKIMLAEVASSGYLSQHGKCPYLRLAVRYYADLAGVSHQIESYRELYESSALGRRDAGTVAADLDPCEVTHTIFYTSDFGFRDPGLRRHERDRAYRIVRELTDHHVQRAEWDLAAKLVLAQFCLGGDPVATASGATAIRMLMRVQTPGGAIPGPSYERRAGESATPVEFFRTSYQATLVTALMALIVSSAADSRATA